MKYSEEILAYAVSNTTKEKVNLRDDLMQKFHIANSTAYKYIKEAREVVEKKRTLERLEQMERQDQERLNKKYARKRTMKFVFDDSKLMQIGR